MPISLRGLFPLLLCAFCACGQQTNQNPGDGPKIVVSDGGQKALTLPPNPEDVVEPGVAKPGPKNMDAEPTVPTPSELLTQKPQSVEESLLPTQNIGMSSNADEKYESKVADAFRLLTDGKEEDALAALQDAKAAKETDFVNKEIERVQGLIDRSRAAEKTASDINTVLVSGRPEDASRLAGDALQQYGDTDMAEKLTSLKRQADALVATRLEDQQGKQRFLVEATGAVKAKNLRAAAVAYEQAIAQGATDVAVQKDYDAIRVRLTTYDSNRAKAAELRRDAYKLEEALVALKAAREAWDTPQIQQEISEAEFALTSRRDRLAIADFEVVGDVGIPLAGRTIAEEILPYFKTRFDLVERTQLNAIVGELKLESGSLGSNEAARTQVAQLAKARFLVVGSVGRLNGLTVNARLVDVRSGLIVQTAKIAAATPEELQRKLPALAKILQLTDEQKINFDTQIAKVETVEPPKQLVIAEPPVVVVNAPPPPPIIINSYTPPPVGTVVVQDFDRLVIAQPGTTVVLSEAPPIVRQRAMCISVEVGDNLFRCGRYAEAIKHFEFALNLAPERREIAVRIDRCRPFCPPVVVIPQQVPRLAVLPFVEIGDPRILQTGIGCWTAERLAPYFQPPYEIVDQGQIYYWMNRLGMTMQDVICNPAARLVLARAVNARAFLVGNLRQDLNGIEATAKVLNPEFNVVTNAATIRVLGVPELRFRLPELARLTLLPPAPPEQVVVIQQQQQRYDELVIEINRNVGRGNFALAFQFTNQARELRPDSVEVRALYIDVDRRRRFNEVEQARQIALAQELERQRLERERQLQLAVAAENARRLAEQQAAIQAAQQRQGFLQQQQQAQLNLVLQARNNLKVNNFAVAINLFESANAMHRNDEVTRELAQTRALAAQQQRQLFVQQQQAREAEIQRQRDAEVAAAQQRLIADQQRQQQAEQIRAAAEQRKLDGEYQRLMDAAQRFQATGNLNAQVSALQAARRIKPSPEIERLVNAALVEQAKATADQKGATARQELEKQLALERDRRTQAEAEAEKNRKLYEEAINNANSAMKARNFETAQVQFRKASLLQRTDESVKGLQAAQDEQAKAKALADAETKKKAEAVANEANFQRLVSDGKSALQTKKFDQAVSLFKAATQLKPGDVTAQTELARAEQARSDNALALRKEKEQQENLAQVKKLIAAANTNLAAKQHDAAIVSLNEALKLDPKNSEATRLLADAQAQHNAMVKDEQARLEAKKKRDDYESLMQKGRTAMSLKNLAAAEEAFQSAQKLLPGDAASAQLIQDIEKQKSAAETARLTKLKQDEETARAAKLKQEEQARLAKEAQAMAEKKRLDEERVKAEKVVSLMTQARALIAVRKLDEADKALAEMATLSPNDPEAAKLREQSQTLRRSMAADDLETKKRQQAYADAMQRGQIAMSGKKYDEAILAFRDALKVVPNDRIAQAAEANATKLRGDAIAALTPKVEPKKELPKIEPKVEPKIEPKKELPKIEPKVEPKIEPKKELPKIEPIVQPKIEPKKEMPKIEPIVQPKIEPKIEPKKELPKADPVRVAYDQHVAAARDAMTRKQFEVAIQQATAALQLVPNDPEATRIVLASREAIKPTPKIEPKKEMPKVDPAIAQAQQLLQAAAPLEAASKYGEALPLFEQALKLAPNDPNLKKKTEFIKFMATGQQEMATNKIAEAVQSFDQAAKLFPDNQDAQKWLQQARTKKK